MSINCLLESQTTTDGLWLLLLFFLLYKKPQYKLICRSPALNQPVKWPSRGLGSDLCMSSLPPSFSCHELILSFLQIFWFTCPTLYFLTMFNN